MRTVYWDYDQASVNLIDQRKLPFDFEVVSFHDYHDVATAISDMYVRGAPAIGATAAFGMALAAYQSSTTDIGTLQEELREAADHLNAARPTAVNLSSERSQDSAILSSIPKNLARECTIQFWQLLITPAMVIYYQT